MPSTEDVIILIIASGELITGFLVNGFIGLVTSIEWIKKKKLSTIDYILTSLAISRICLLCVITESIFLMTISPKLYVYEKLRVIIVIFWTLSNQSASWFGTCLSVFYLLKIASFSHPLFLWLKWRIDRAVVHILLGCLTMCLLIILVLVIILDYKNQFYVLQDPKNNITELFDVINYPQFQVLNIFAWLGIVPFTVSLISLCLLIISLWRHKKQMKHDVAGCRDLGTAAHVGAMKTVTSFLLLLFLYHLASLFVCYSYRMTRQKQVILLGETISILYPLVHSFILILDYKKLRQASARILLCRKTNPIM